MHKTDRQPVDLDPVVDSALADVEAGRDPAASLAAADRISPGSRLLLIAQQLVEVAHFLEVRCRAPALATPFIQQASSLLPRLGTVLHPDDMAWQRTREQVQEKVRGLAGLDVPSGGVSIRRQR